MKDRQGAPVLVVGAHRSGTSATARALEILGLQIGQCLDSHCEPRSLQRLHEEYLRRVGAAWHEPTPFLEWVRTPQGERDCTDYLCNHIRREFASIFGYRNNPKGFWLRARLKLGMPWGWKEPRTTLFAPSWLERFPNARIVHVIRHPLAAAVSIRQRELAFRAAGDPPTGKIDSLEYCLSLVLTYVESGERLASLTPRYRRVRFEDIQANPAKALDDLANLCGLHFTTTQMAAAIASIRPESFPPWRDVSKETALELLSRHPIVTKLGYE